ncbi:hypothetical protein CPB84DRAFT_1827860 [Gymnopilus junonius]|uniref:Uncharacterized protein n=1 Tax=Gymnopilus junonius TaxID=109634 RepID=A0A9P5NFT1_GYMJU|nr:hypothetical protein CPB84DRAFT_1827860 [Gymnopilus junonius]
MTDADLLLSPEMSWDLDFVGYSLGVYLTSNILNPYTVTALYAVDDQAPTKFTIKNTATEVNPSVVGLILQTPVYPLGQYHIHITFPNVNNHTFLTFWQAIIQKTTSHNLQIFPPRRRKRSKFSDKGSESALAADPFILPRILRIEAMKRRALMEGQSQVRGRSKAEQRPNNVAINTINQPVQRVIVHVDSEDQPDVPEQVVEVLEPPPAYRPVRRSITSLEPPAMEPIPEPTTDVIRIREKVLRCRLRTR